MKSFVFRLPATKLSPCISALNSNYALFPTTLGLPRHISTTSVDGLTQHETQSRIQTNEKLVGQSGRHYLIERVLQSKGVPPSHVYLTTCVSKGSVAGMSRLTDDFCARCGNQKFVVKNILADLKYYQDMQQALGDSLYLRLLQDTIFDRSMFVYKYLNDHLLSLAQKNLPLLLAKRILKDALRGLAELHRQNIVHTG